MRTVNKVVNPTILGQPLALTDKYRPTRIDQFLALRDKEALVGFAANPYPSNLLFHGPTGVGKTSAAIALAEGIAAELHHLPGKACTVEQLEKLCRECCYAPHRTQDWKPAQLHLALIDEVDAASYPAQLLLLSKLDGTATPPATVFLFTTNEIETLEQRFVSRCRTVEFTMKGAEMELAKLLSEIWSKEAPGCNAPDFQQIARAANGDNRAALNTLETLILSSRKLPGEVSYASKPTGVKALPDCAVKQSPTEMFHPLSQVFPEVSPESFAALKLDVAERGVRVPVVIFEGLVLDGRSRWRAAQELGVRCPTLDYDGSKPLLEVVSLNAIRRLDLTSSQRAMAAARIANLNEGRPTKTQSIDGVSEEKAARLLKVSVKSVERAKKVLGANRPDLIDAVSSGRMSVSRAANSISTRENGTPTPIEASTKSSPKNALTRDPDPVWLWKEMLLFEERRIMDSFPADLLDQMSQQQSVDVLRIAPALIAWLQGLVGERWESDTQLHNSGELTT
jgi:DNA polymerase III delta prime subunit